MSDRGLRGIERRWQRTGAVEDEASYLGARIRAGELSTRALARAALFGSPAARMITDDFHQAEEQDLTQEEMDEVFRLVFRGIDVPPETREFLGNIVRHDQEARATLDHYGLVEEDDKAPPEPDVAIKALMDHLRENSSHREAIAQMNRPVFQLIPVYEPEGAGFQRMVNALDAHPRDWQLNTYVRNELRTRWRMTEGRGKIVGWQVAVVEGDKELPEERNPHRNETLEEQLRLWQEECAQRGLELSDNRSYALLQMREIMTSPEGTPLAQLGIDPNTFTVLKDSTRRQTGSLVPGGSWNVSQVRFFVSLPDNLRDYARFRPSVVVKKIL